MEITEYKDASSLKSALELLLGRNEWDRLKDAKGITIWRSSLDRALRMSEAAFSGTVEIADERWREEIAEIIAKGREDIRKSTNLIDLFSSFSATYLQLSFLQLGHMPNMRGKRVNKRAVPREWDMRDFRTVQYVQTEQQRLRLEWHLDRRDFSIKVIDPRYSNFAEVRKKVAYAQAHSL